MAIAALLALQACEEDNELTFTATPPADGVVFTTDFSSEYLLSEDTEDNIAERFVWEPVDFGAPVNVTYDLHASISPEFDEFDVVGSTAANNLGITVGTLLDYAENQGLDDDPATTDENGNPNNTGTVYFRLRAYAGAGTGNATEAFSDTEALSVRLIEQEPAGAGCPSIFVVGAGAPDAGWNWNSPIEFTCDSDVFTAKLELANDAFRFFTEEGNWDSGLNYPYYVDEGYTIDTLLENAEDGDSNFRFVGEPGVYTVTVDDVNRTITVEEGSSLWLVGAATPGGWSWDAPTEAPQVDPNVWSVTMELTNEAFRFFTEEGNWDSGLNYPYYVDAGYTIDPDLVNAEDGDSNFSFVGTPGTYTVTVNDLEQTITLNQ